MDMPVLQKKKTSKKNPNTSYFLTIPIKVVELYGWKKGDEIEIIADKLGLPYLINRTDNERIARDYQKKEESKNQSVEY